jgi:isoleucyl-tRNA synthetase
VTIRCAHCGEEGVRRIPEVGDAWLDAGIVPFSTLGWQNPEYRVHGYATGAADGLTGADLPDNAYWERWFPADWISEMREQIRLWFHSIGFMSMTLVGRLPYRAVLTYEKVHDEAGRPMHKSWGNAIEANEALDRMGADVMRWLYCGTIPSQNVNFGYGPANEVKKRLLTLWNSVSFLVTYANIGNWRPRYADLAEGPDATQPLDRWLVARTQRFLDEATRALDAYWSPDLVDEFEAFVDDLSNWYIRRSRRRFWEGDPRALRTLWYALVQGLRAVAPVMPFLTEHLWRNLVAGACADAPASIHLAGWPFADAALVDEELVEEIAAVRQVVELGRQARASSGVKLRQPLKRMVVFGAPRAERHREEIESELRIKHVTFEQGAVARVRFKPNLPVLGPRLGRRLPEIRRALERNDYRTEGDNLVVDGEVLTPEEYIRERLPVSEGWIVAGDGDASVELDAELDEELVLEGRVLDLIHKLNAMRKEAGLELTDRIVVTLPPEQAELLRYEEQIKEETLAVEVRADGGSEPTIAKVESAH